MSDYLDTGVSTNASFLNFEKEALSVEEAEEKYLSKDDATLTYLSKTEAANTYLSQTFAEDEFLTKDSAANIYLNKSDAAEIYLSQNNASLTYLTQNSADSNYLHKSGYIAETITGLKQFEVTPKVSNQASTGYTNLATDENVVHKNGDFAESITGEKTFLTKPFIKLTNNSTSPVATESEVSSTYLSQTLAASTYLNQTSASNTYLSKTEATSIYLTQNSANSTFLKQSDAATTYLTQNAASSTYLTQASASSTYLTQTNAANTYLTSANASSVYGKVTGGNNWNNTNTFYKLAVSNQTLYNYDSGWFAVGVSSYYDITHNLMTFPIRIQMYFSPNPHEITGNPYYPFSPPTPGYAGDEVFEIHSQSHGGNYNNPTNTLYGISHIRFIDLATIRIGTARDGLFYSRSAVNVGLGINENYTYTSGYLRVYLFR